MHHRLLPLSFLFFTLPVTAQTVTDIDGNVYNTVTIGGQVWMTENLVTTHYQDGSPIPFITNPTTWFNLLVSGARCYYFNDSAAYAGYGALYNWNAVSSPLNICPSGWHVPTDAEWNTMTTFLDPTVDPEFEGFTGTGTTIGDQLKEVGEAHWDIGNEATNSSGFTALGAGYRRSNGLYEYINAFGYFWTSTYGEFGKAYVRVLDHDEAIINRFILDRLYGASVRCMADVSTVVPEGRLNELQLFPNPASADVQLVGLPNGPVHLVITDATGRQVRTHQLNGTMRSISVADLVPGAYLLSIDTTAGRQQARLWVR